LAAGLLQHQQAFDWAVIQTEALARLRAAGVEVPSKLITYSASSREADLFLDRGLLVSRLEGWVGPLLDMARCRYSGVHHAENLMAALAVGRILRIPLEEMVRTLVSLEPLPGRYHSLGRVGEVEYVDDSHSTHLECLRQALMGATGSEGGRPNLLLISGGRQAEGDAYALGPLLSRRVKRVFLVGAAQNLLRSAWSLFTPCSTAPSLLEAVTAAAAAAVPGDVVLFSPACSGSETLSTTLGKGAGDVFREAVFSFRELQEDAASGPGVPGSDGASAARPQVP
jgi:UDP-N-acetylmuramoylalanine--D-glutamate ligase